MYIEDFGDLQTHIQFLLRACRLLQHSSIAYRLPQFAEITQHVTEQFKCLSSRCKFSKRWAANYRDRINILINLVGHCQLIPIGDAICLD